MTDAQIEKVLARDLRVAAVLLSRGGWLKAEAIRMRKAFEADDHSAAIWVVELLSPIDEPWHQVYVEAATVVGISVVSYDSQPSRPD